MDLEQTVDIINTHKEYLSDRNRLKGLLSDVLADDRMHINLLLNVFDEGIVNDLINTNDKGTTALKGIKNLRDNYGISEANAKWAIQTWCHILKYDDIYELLKDLSLEAGDSSTKDEKEVEKKKEPFFIGIGTYCSGYDFPEGRVRLEAKWKMQKGDIHFEIGDSPDVVITYGSPIFSDTSYLEIKKGQFIKFLVSGGANANDILSFKAEAI